MLALICVNIMNKSVFLFNIQLIQNFAYVNSQVTSLKMTRHQKRKIDETHVEVLDAYFTLRNKNTQEHFPLQNCLYDLFMEVLI